MRLFLEFKLNNVPRRIDFFIALIEHLQKGKEIETNGMMWELVN